MNPLDVVGWFVVGTVFLSAGIVFIGIAVAFAVGIVRMMKK